MNRQELKKKIQQIMPQLIAEKGYASALDLFLKMGKITAKQVEDWRFGRVPCLERVLHGNLAQFSFIMIEFRRTAKQLNLNESHTTYMSWGKGQKRVLRFSKSGDARIECNYSTHYVQIKSVQEC